jgi:predicted DNA-binding WGR domain protein
MSGGEKRLNVAFSRAKHHMAIVSSIHYGEITNDYNEGAACFKNYLRYAEAVSSGRADAAKRVLHGLCRWHEFGEIDDAVRHDPVADQLAATISRHGLVVDREVGQSHFRCDLAVRRPEEAVYRLGILIDNVSYYEQSDIMERDVMRPRLLRNFGWNVCQVFAKDWHQDPERVVERVLRLISGQTEFAPDEVDGEKPEPTADGAMCVDTPPVAMGSEHNNAATDEQAAAPPQPDRSEQPSSPAITSSVTTAIPGDGRTTRYFELSDAKSHKFWEISLCGGGHNVRFGRIGTAGQELSKTFDDPLQARADFERLIRQKLAKGYQEKDLETPKHVNDS